MPHFSFVVFKLHQVLCTYLLTRVDTHPVAFWAVLNLLVVRPQLDLIKYQSSHFIFHFYGCYLFSFNIAARRLKPLRSGCHVALVICVLGDMFCMVNFYCMYETESRVIFKNHLH